MQELIEKLKTDAGLTEEQAVKSLHTIKDYIHSKVPPMFSGFVDNFFADTSKDGAGDDFMDTARNATKNTAETIEKIAGSAKEHAESFAKDAGEKMSDWSAKAGEAAQDTISKLKNMMEDKNKPRAK